MKKNLFVFIVFLILNSCAGFEFAYNTKESLFIIKNFTHISVDGDDAYQVYILLR